MSVPNPLLVPKQGAAITASALCTNEWYLFFKRLAEYLQATGIDPSVITDILDRLAALEADADASFLLQGLISVVVSGTPAGGLVQLSLQGDVATPGNTYYYGTGPTGTKGWFTIASTITAAQDGIELVTGPDGVTDIRPDHDLAALEALATTGLAARTGSDTWALRTIQDGPGVDWTNPDGVAGDPLATFNADTAPVASLPGATYNTLQKLINVMMSPGLIKGGEFTDGGGGNLNVAGGTIAIRNVDDDVSQLYMANFPGATLAIPNDSLTHFVGVERNGSNPQVIMKTTDVWNMDTEFRLGTVANLGGTLFPFYNPDRVGDPTTNILQRFEAAGMIRGREGGILLGNTGVREATLSPGRVWAKLDDYQITQKTSSLQPMISVRPNPASPPPLIFTPGLTQWPNTQYLSGTTLTTMTNNRWANLWFFVNIGSNSWGFAYGTAEYLNSSQAAQEGIPPYLTANFLANNLLVGRFIFEKSNNTPIIESAFTRVFGTQAVSDHNQLSNLQGGTTGEYYHLTAAEYAALSSLADPHSAILIRQTFGF